MVSPWGRRGKGIVVGYLRCRALAKLMDRLWFGTARWKRLDQGGLEGIREWCKSVSNPVLIAIDTLKKVRPPKRNGQSDYDADYEACEGLQKLAGEWLPHGPPKLFRLTYRHSDGRAAGVVVIESGDLLHARLKASLAGAGRGLEFVSAHRPVLLAVSSMKD
jgi:hypothetical protein